MRAHSRYWATGARTVRGEGYGSQVLRIVYYRCSACYNMCTLRSVVYVPFVRALVQSLVT
jgi:hypothetical protein